MLYSKNGSVPKPETDGTEGWIEVPDAPQAGDGQEVVWWYPPGWIVRPIMPVKEGYTYNWSQSNGEWAEMPVVEVLPDVITVSAIDGSSDSMIFSGSGDATLTSTGAV